MQYVPKFHELAYMFEYFHSQKDFETAANLYKRATEIKESDAAYQGKELSTRSSSGETNSTVKNLLHS